MTNVDLTHRILALAERPAIAHHAGRRSARPRSPLRARHDQAARARLGAAGRRSTTGLAATVAWYRANEWWWRPIKEQDPAFRAYYQAQYRPQARARRLTPHGAGPTLVTGATGFVGGHCIDRLAGDAAARRLASARAAAAPDPAPAVTWEAGRSPRRARRSRRPSADASRRASTTSPARRTSARRGSTRRAASRDQRARHAHPARGRARTLASPCRVLVVTSGADLRVGRRADRRGLPARADESVRPLEARRRRARAARRGRGRPRRRHRAAVQPRGTAAERRISSSRASRGRSR